MLMEDVYRTIKKYTDDSMILNMVKYWLCLNSILNVFKFSFKRKFKLNIKRKVTDREIKTSINITVGYIFKRTFSVSNIEPIKRGKIIRFILPENKKVEQQPINNADNIYAKPSDLTTEFYNWKKRQIAKKIG